MDGVTVDTKPNDKMEALRSLLFLLECLLLLSQAWVFMLYPSLETHGVRVPQLLVFVGMFFLPGTRTDRMIFFHHLLLVVVWTASVWDAMNFAIDVLFLWSCITKFPASPETCRGDTSLMYVMGIHALFCLVWLFCSVLDTIQIVALATNVSVTNSRGKPYHQN